ncbi:MAG: ABC transporter permease [Bacillota bacterium]
MKKEFREILGTYRIYVVPSVFLLMGFASPILAKLTPELVRSMAAGFKIELPTPTAVDAWTQFLKNLNQIVLLAVILSLIGLVAEEKVRGTAVLVLTKPLSRRAFILGKYAAAASLVLFSTFLSYLACLSYTVALFGEALFRPSLAAVALVALYYLLILAVTLFASTIAKSVALSGAMAVGWFFFLSLLPALHPWLARYSPGALVRYQNAILTRSATLADALPAAGVTILVAVFLIAAAVIVFGRQEL